MIQKKLQALSAMNLVPGNEASFNEWLRANEVEEFLIDDANSDDLIIYAGLDHVFIHAVLIPSFTQNDESIGELLTWNFNASSGWGICSSGEDVRISNPLEHQPIELIQSGEQIVFIGGLEGVPGRNTYFELNQKIAHALSLHNIEERRAWCKLDGHGDIDETVKVHSPPDAKGQGLGVITMRKEELCLYATLGDFVLLRMFDFTRFRLGDFSGWPEGGNIRKLGGDSNVFGSVVLHQDIGSYTRGIQLIRISKSRETLKDWVFGRRDQDKEYAKFIAHDWRNGGVRECSCAPEKLGNYFESSSLPYEISPVYFRPEVLGKYKLDSDKYELEQSSISCRGTWHLQRYGINDEGQVFTYLGYLSGLPYAEQLHWKQYNEKPKADLPHRVIKTDFLAEFSDEYDPLVSLRLKLEELARLEVGWWVLRNESLPKRVHYPVTNSRDEWANEFLNLDQFLVEGLSESWLRKKAETLDRNPDSRLRALKLLEEVLCGLGFEEDHARELMSPWHLVHNLRSELKGHASNSAGKQQEREAIREHGSLVNHFKSVCTECVDSLRVIADALANSTNETD